MRTSRRARRMQRQHDRLGRKGGLHLVSLMDVFTILVFFLLVNTANTQQLLPNPDQIKLPESTADAQATQSTVVVVTANAILVNGSSVVRRATIRASDRPRIPQLSQALVSATPQAAAPLRADEAPLSDRGKLTIMADKQLPYRLIRKVMLTGTAVGFTRISLAVIQDGQR